MTTRAKRSLTCQLAIGYAESSPSISSHLHDGCPGVVFDALTQRTFECVCSCHFNVDEAGRLKRKLGTSIDTP